MDELIKDTLTYIRQNYKATDTLLASSEDMAYFNPQAQALPVKTQEILPPLQKSLPQPPLVSPVEKKAFIEPLRIPEPVITPPPQAAPTISQTPLLKSSKVEGMEEMQRLVSKVAPHIKLKSEIPDDTRAKKIANHWQEQLQTLQVAIFSFGETEKNLVFLHNVAAAITSLIGPAKVVDANRFEKEKKWELFFASNTLKLILAPAIQGWKTTQLATYYKANPTTTLSRLGEAPLLTLQPLSVYLKNPKEKRLLWNSIVSHLSS